MQVLVYRVGEEHGIHARPAGRLVNFVKTLSCDVRITNGAREADGKKLLAVMSLGARYGDELTFCLSGEAEEQEKEALATFVRENMTPGD